MLRFREPSKDGPAATRVKTTRGHQVLVQDGPTLALHTARAVHYLRSPPVGFSGLGKAQRWVFLPIGLGAGGVQLGSLARE